MHEDAKALFIQHKGEYTKLASLFSAEHDIELVDVNGWANAPGKPPAAVSELMAPE